MQELIEWIENGNETSFYVLRDKAKKLLKKEKNQIIDAYYGNIDGVFGYREEGEEYYNQTYNSKKSQGLISTSDNTTEWITETKDGITIHQSKLKNK